MSFDPPHSLTKREVQVNSSREVMLIVCAAKSATHDKAQDRAKLELGRRIKAAREREGLSQFQLAMKLGITPGAVGQWELGMVSPKPLTMMRLPEILGMTSEELLESRTPAGRQMVALTTKERDLITAFRRMPEAEQDLIARQIKALAGIK